MTSSPPSSTLKSRAATVVTVMCIVTVAVWELGMLWAKTPVTVHNLDPAQFAKIDFIYEGSRATPESLEFDDSQANLLVMSVPLSRDQDGSQHAVVRLVHGYNMRDCMRIKGYDVTQISTVSQDQPIEIWQLRSSKGVRSVWLTAMVRSSDFSYAPVSVTALAFPRVDIPDEQDWTFQGLTSSDMKHPLLSLRSLIRTKWNGARSDPGTFLRVKRPSRPSSDLLTVIALSENTPETENSMVSKQLEALLKAFVQTLQAVTPHQSVGL